MPDYVKQMRERDALDSPFGFEVTRQYRVMGPTTELAALSATDSVTGTRVPSRTLFGGDPLPENSLYTVFSRDAVWQDYSQEYGDIWIVRIIYRSPQFDQQNDLQLEWEWDQQFASIPSTSDLNGNPLLNLAGDPLIGGYDKDVIMPVLRCWVTRQYSPTLANTIANTVNTSSMTLFSGSTESFTIDAEQMKCLYYKPIERLKTTGNQVRIETAFAFLPGYRPWQLKAANAGFNGWYFGTNNASRKGRFHFNTNGEPCEDAVLLNTAGRPLDGTDTFRVTRSLEVCVSSPESYGWIEPRQAPGGIGWELIFDRYETYEFTGFITGVM